MAQAELLAVPRPRLAPQPALAWTVDSPGYFCFYAFTITEKAFSWLNVPTSDLTFKTLC